MSFQSGSTFEGTVAGRWPLRVAFTSDALDAGNPTLRNCVHTADERPARVAVVIDSGMAAAWPGIQDAVQRYLEAHSDRMTPGGAAYVVEGGERCKAGMSAAWSVVELIERAGIDRHGYVLAIGGGALLDCAGFAAAIAHRGVRLIRMPTTTMGQADAGVGVKNGINAMGKKNFVGTFTVPAGVVCDTQLVETLSDRDWRCGFAEAVKVGLIRDAALFESTCELADVARAGGAIRQDACDAARQIVQRSAAAHIEHIVHGGDPFETGTGRPLDFGHWAAHQLEAMSDWQLRHGEAVAIGVMLDVIYSHLAGLADASLVRRVSHCLAGLGFELFTPHLRETDRLLAGLEAFREHLGGRLCIPMVRNPGDMVQVSEIDHAIVRGAAQRLSHLARDSVADVSGEL